MRYILVYDILSSGTTTSLFGEDGSLAGRAFCPHQIQFSGERAQQSPQEWVNAIKTTTPKVLAGIDPKQIAVVTFTDQVQVCLCVDQEGQPLMDAFTWSDSRSKEIGDPFAGKISHDAYYHLTGTYNTPRTPLRKLLWVREKMPEIFEKTYKMLGCKEYIIRQLTGEFVAEYSAAVTTGAFNIRERCWDRELLRMCGLPEDKLPAPVGNTQFIGTVSAGAAQEFGLPQGVPVFAGAGDLTSSAVGAGATNEGDCYMSVSSSSWIAVVSRQPVLSSKMLVENTIHAADGLYLAYGNLQEISATIKWLKNGVLYYGDSEERVVAPFKNYYPYDQMGEEIAGTAAGANGLLFLPYLLGPGTSPYDVNPYAAYLGLTVDTTRGELVRAGLEGATFAMKTYLQLFREHYAIRQITATSAASKEEFWMQIMADIFEAEVSNTNILIPPDAIGAAIMGGAGAGLYPDLNQTDRFRQLKNTFAPRPDQVQRYRTLFELYESAAAALTDVNRQLAALKRK